MAKPPFPLLALLFMHVIPVPAPSPLSLHLPLSLYPRLALLTSPSFLHIFLLLYTQLFLLIGGNYSILAVIPLAILLYAMAPPDLVIATSAKPEEAVTGGRRMKGTSLGAETL